MRLIVVIGLLSISLPLIGQSAAAAGAAPELSSRCSEFEALRRVFPTAALAGFRTRTAVKRAGPREPFKAAKCPYWWTTYTGFRGTGATVDVSVQLFKTRRDALLGLYENPFFGTARTFPNGVLVRTRVSTLATDSGVISVVKNVVVLSVGYGPHDGTYSGRVATNAWLRIHRRIHAAVLR